MDIKVLLNYKDVFYMSDPEMSDYQHMISALQITSPQHKVLFSRLMPSQNKQCLFTLESAAHYTVSGGHLTIRQERPDYQLLLTKDGRADVIYDGQSYTLHQGSALLVNCNKKHRYEVQEGDYWEYKHLHFRTSHPELLLDALPPYIDDFKQTDQIFDEMASFSGSPEATNQIAPYVYSNYINGILTGLLKAKFTLPVDENQKQFLELIEYIREHFDEPISLKTLSEKYHYSESYFIRLFKKYYDDTPYQYLIRYRLAKVKEMLCSGVSVQKAAMSCGFNSCSAFYHALKMEHCSYETQNQT